MTINIVSIILFILAGVSLLVAVYSFIRFNIPQIIGELSGRTAKKSIAQMRNKNINTGDKSHKPSPAAKERGTLTNKIETKNNVKPNSDKTEPLKEKNNFVSNASPATDDNQTELLGDNATEILSDETALLNESAALSSESPFSDEFKIVKNIILVHTDETI